MEALLFNFSASVWKYQGKAAWYFVTLPQDLSEEIRFFSHGNRSAWGSVRVVARIGNQEWKTSLFPDSKLGAYVLPIKADIRKKEKIRESDEVAVECELL